MRDRTVEKRKVRAGDLLPDPLNWRLHPESQVSALRTMLERVGWVDTILVRETDQGLMIVDGHMRADIAEDAMVPVVVVDLSEQEAREVLATYDPIGQLADVDSAALQALIDQLPDEVAGLIGTKTPNISPDDLTIPTGSAEPGGGVAGVNVGEQTITEGDMTNAQAAEAVRFEEGTEPTERVRCPNCGHVMEVSVGTVGTEPEPEPEDGGEDGDAEEPPETITVRDRTGDLVRVRAGDLIADPRNWRLHGSAQERALRLMLERVGIVGALLVRQTDQGLMIVDGHMRAGIDPDTLVPVVMLDIDDDEAGEVLATLDTIAGMAVGSRTAVDALAAEVDAEIAPILTRRPAARVFEADGDPVWCERCGTSFLPTRDDAVIE